MEELALVRAVRVVRGSWNLNGVSVVDSNRERREIREQKRERPLVASDITKMEYSL